jgi:flavorubredoxin
MTAYATTNYEPLAPVRHHEPLRIAPDTYLIRQLAGEGRNPVMMPVNSMVIVGEAPVIVDTGTVQNREDWLNDVFGLVDPEDVKFVFISHDDHDHVGNLGEVLDLCPNATLITSWLQVERLSGDLNLPLTRMRWVNDGQKFKAGERELVAIRPPVYDSPTTRGLFDPRTGVYWASDAFMAPVLQQLEDASEYAPEFWREVFLMSGNMLSPWMSVADPKKVNAQIDRVQALKPKVIAGAHNVTINAKEIDVAFSMMRELPGAPEVPHFDQQMLDGILKQVTGAA